MNYRCENKPSQKDNAPGNIKSIKQKVNANTGRDEENNRRSRSGGYVAWPERERPVSAKERRKPGAP